MPFRGRPGKRLFLPDVHRPAHHPKRIVAVQLGQCVALVEVDGKPCVARSFDQGPERGGMFQRLVLKNQKTHFDNPCNRHCLIRVQRARPPITDSHPGPE